MQISAYIKQHVTIQQVVSHYGIKLKRTNGGWMCVCPWHADSSASLSVRDKGYFKCFAGCAKGDLFAFVQKMDGFPTFLETAAAIIETFNIPPPQKLIRKQLREQIRKEPDIEKAKALQAKLLEIRKSLSNHEPGL